MRWFIIVFATIFAVIFIGGAIDIGGKPIFGHIDTVLGTTALMGLHQGTFFILYRGEGTIGDGLDQTEDDVKEFSERPLGFDKAETYRKLDKASDY